MQCPFCQEEVGSEDELQLHCLVCTSAYADSVSAPIVPGVDSVVVRFRWVKSRPCIEREVHLISSLAGSVTLRGKFGEGYYESETVGVPVGEHICQLAIGGDVISTEPFEVNADSDVIFVIPQEDPCQSEFSHLTFGERDRRARISTDEVGSPRLETEPTETRHRPLHLLDMEARETRENTAEVENEMSPLYRELLQHQLSHGAPSWVPGSGVQSPVMSEVDFSDLAGLRRSNESPSLTPQPDSMEELQPQSPLPIRPVPLQAGHEVEGLPGDLSGESDGVQSHAGEQEDQDQSENEAEEVQESSRPPAAHLSSSPVPSSHSEHESRLSSRNSPANSVPSEVSARDDVVISPLPDETLRHGSPPPISGNQFTEEHTNVISPHTSPRITPGGGHLPTEETVHRSSAVQTSTAGFAVEYAHSSPRTSPVGSVLETVTVPVTGTNTSNRAEMHSDREANTLPQRRSPAGSVHSSSLFSSGLPTPIMSPRGRSQSATDMPPASRGNPLGSIHVQTQLPLRPQSLGGSVNLTDRVPISASLLADLNPSLQQESPRIPISGVEGSQSPPAMRRSPPGSIHGSSVQPPRGFGVADDSCRHSSQRNTPVLSVHSGSGRGASHFVAPPRNLPLSDHGSGNSTSLAHIPQQRTSGPGSPTQFLMEAIYTPATESGTAPSRTGSAEAPPPVTPLASLIGDHRERENSTPVVEDPRHGTSGDESTSDHNPPLVPCNVAASVPPLVFSSSSFRAGHRESENSTPILNHSIHRTSTPGSQSELLVETTRRQGTPSTVSRHGSIPGTPPVLPSTSPRASNRGSENGTPTILSSGLRRSGARSPSELLAEIAHRRGTPPVSTHATHRMGSSRQSSASSVHSRPKHSPPRVVSPPFPHESAIPSHVSAFAAVDGQRGASSAGLASEIEALRVERDSLTRDLRQRTAELRQTQSINQDLQQQILSIETVANLTKQDGEKTRELEQTVQNLNRTLRDKEEEMGSLQESMRTLERTNQQLKEELESLKTVNELQLDDIKRINKDLETELSTTRLALDSSKTKRGREEGKVIELKTLNNTYEQHIRRLEEEKAGLKAKLKKAKQEIETMKAWGSSRLGRAKSETDLSRKFEKYPAVDGHCYRDPKSSRAVNFTTSSRHSSVLETTRFNSWDTNYTRSPDIEVSSPVIMNGHGSLRSETKPNFSYTCFRDALPREPYTTRTTVPRHRVGSLGEESDMSDDLDHGVVGYHTATQSRLRPQSPDSSASSVVSWDRDYSTDESRSPRASAYNQSSSLYRDDRGGGRRARPHSYHGGK